MQFTKKISVMKNFAFLLLLVFSAFTVSAQQNTYSISKAQMTISGTSSLHDWKSDVKKVTGQVTATVNNGALASINGTFINVDVYSIKSAKGSMMDNNTYSTLKAKKFPTIAYQLTQSKVTGTRGNVANVAASGVLTLAGQARAIDMAVTATVLGNGDLQIQGTKTIKMSDFGIDPPTFMLGSLKTGDDVTIQFNVTFARGPLASQK
jgi:polyisoprenoid-binding protein YceI